MRSLPELNEFESKGFVRATNASPNLLKRLRLEYKDNFRVFKSGLRGCGNATSSKHGSRNLFGDHLHYYYDVRRKEEFVDYLVYKFYKDNPDAKYLKGEFTRLLHSHGLHWKECCR